MNSRIHYFTCIHNPSPSILVNLNATSVSHHFDVETVNVSNGNRVIASAVVGMFFPYRHVGII